jgi:CRP-like cAMP-binding protein
LNLEFRTEWFINQILDYDNGMPARRKTPLEIKTAEPHMCSINRRLEIIGHTPFFNGLPDKDLNQINRLFKETGYQPEETICFSGDPAERLFILAEGRVQLLRHTNTGKDVLLDILSPGEIFGSLSLLGDPVYPDTAVANTPCCVLQIGMSDFQSVLEEYPSVTMKVLEMTATRLHTAQERVRQLSALSVEGRIAHILLLLSAKFGKPDKVGMLIQAPFTREDLAAMAGTTSESASRVMSQFQRAGLIETGRQWVAVTDQAGLEQLTDMQ